MWFLIFQPIEMLGSARDENATFYKPKKSKRVVRRQFIMEIKSDIYGLWILPHYLLCGLSPTLSALQLLHPQSSVVIERTTQVVAKIQ